MPDEPPELPPEVLEEFAAAYRAAYEQALIAQGAGPTHRDEGDDDEPGTTPPGAEPGVRLPRRRGPLLVGTHRTDSEQDDSTWVARVRDSGWLVVVLLAVLACLLVLGAYAVGRAFSDRVDADGGARTGVTSVSGGGAA